MLIGHVHRIRIIFQDTRIARLCVLKNSTRFEGYRSPHNICIIRFSEYDNEALYNQRISVITKLGAQKINMQDKL